MVGPWLHYLEILAARGRELSDIEFLSIKESEGKVRSDEGTLVASGDLAILTANAGKDMYLGTAKCTFQGSAGTGIESAQLELLINGVPIEKVSFLSEAAGGDSAVMLTFNYEFKNIGRKVTTGQIIKIEITSVSGTVSLRGFIECFEEDTGVSPQIPSI